MHLIAPSKPRAARHCQNPPASTWKERFIPTSACRCGRSHSAPTKIVRRHASRRTQPVASMTPADPGATRHFDGDVEQGLSAVAPDMDPQARRRRGIPGPRMCRPKTMATSAPAMPSALRERRGGLSPLRAPENAKRQPLRASAGHPVTQLWYARQGIITPEMEFIAIRENLGRAKIARIGEGHRPQRSQQTARRLRATCRRRAVMQQSLLHAFGLPPLPAAHPRARSRPSSSATKSPPAAPSSRPTSITRNPSR